MPFSENTFSENTAGRSTSTVNPSELFAPNEGPSSQYYQSHEDQTSQYYQSHEDQTSDLSGQGPYSDSFYPRDAFPHTPADVQRALYLSHEDGDQTSDLSGQGPYS
ncbi:hypothetical protein, partial [Dictyobacter arantiisoli]|uniref:hypothetical protein n=1 Tax=Dictyobacter arantiisoli TaxID=2014874 RepID=UPI0011ECBCEF